MKRYVVVAGGVAAVGAVLWVTKVRHLRLLHPKGRSYSGELEVWGWGSSTGASLFDRPGRHAVTVRLSKGVGTAGGRADVRGIAIRVHGQTLDLLLSSVAGGGRVTRRVPMPRRTFRTVYGAITPYRTATRKIMLEAVVDDDGILLRTDERDVGRVTIGRPLADGMDAALAFDPVRNSADDLHPTGTIHGVRAFAYRFSQRWRGAEPAPDHPRAVARTNLHG